ncbi:hypothetical protein L596_017395 [Steinernema carpocapsae]|uniref:ATP-dependent RNA helicase n=2 Tax=Steinernema carpocapsae TaxID=34508 RepID=A0A4U5N1J4_STECR|nr:hypothetical protein L596_017395 [Steinernema carpocapsae]
MNLMTAFEELGVLPELGESVSQIGWELPTDIQSEAIPAILGGCDVFMAAETGSGKTGAFCIPVIQITWESMRDQLMGKQRKAPKNISQDDAWALNIYDKDKNLMIKGMSCRCSDGKNWHGSRGNKGVKAGGKYYFEAFIAQDGLCRVGWSTLDAKLNLGTDEYGYGFGGTGKKSHRRSFDEYGESFTLQDTIGCYLDLDNRTIHWAKNGKEFEIAYKIDKKFAVSTFFPAILLQNSELELNFGDSPFRFPPKNDYIGLSQAKLQFTEVSSITTYGRLAQANKERPLNAPICVILEPTMELARQTHNQIELFKKKLTSPTLRSALVVGGKPMAQQLSELSEGVDIVTCTTGRFKELVGQEKICLDFVRFFILDEADQLVAGFQDRKLIHELHDKIPRYAPTGERLQMVVCSATLHNVEVKKLEGLMHFPQWVDLKGQDSVPDTVHHVVCLVDPKADKSWIRLRSTRSCITTDGIHANSQIRPGSEQPDTLSEAVKILKGEYVVKAIKEHNMDQCIIFCRTKLDCDNLEKYLKATDSEMTCVCLHGDRSPQERNGNLEAFKQKSVKFLICTDVAARGIDVRGVPYVINVTLPPKDEKQNYVHRIGRVGRADRMGLAISLVSTVSEKVWYHSCRSRGVNCHNTDLTSQKGCAIWYNEVECLSLIEQHLGVTIGHVENDMAVPVNEFDGKVTYGSKRSNQGSMFTGHAVQLSGVVAELNDLERSVQFAYLHACAH